MDEVATYHQYLRDLKVTVEGLLVTQVANVWSIYGGLNRLHSCLEKIFQHGCKNGDGDFYNFIQGLEWLQPESSTSYFSVDSNYKPHMLAHLKGDKSAIWLYTSLENHSLSQKLSWLLSDNTHLLNCYEPCAFLCQDSYCEATLICLRAVERNQPSLLSEIDPCLFLFNTNQKDITKTHRRCISSPENQINFFDKNSKSKSIKTLDLPKKSTNIKSTVKVYGKIKPWASLPSLLEPNKMTKNDKKHLTCHTTPCTPLHTKKIPPSVLRVDYTAIQASSSMKHLKKPTLKKSTGKIKDLKPDTILEHKYKDYKHLNIENIVEHTPPSSSHSSGTLLDTFQSCSMTSQESPRNISTSPLSMVEYRFLPLPMPGEKDHRTRPKKSFIEDGGMSVLPMATGFFPKPTKGQSLTSFLSSSQFARTNAELDRENAHFSISEAIISAMEQLKCKRDLKLADEQMDESDPEITDLKQRIRLRRREKLVEKHRKQWHSAFLSDEKSDTTMTVSPNSTPTDSFSDSSESDIHDLEIDEANNLQDNQALSMSMASLYSEADIAKRPRGVPDGASDVLSAEGVALSLISKFNEKYLPRASDLEWLVSEEDAPQALLPLPKSWPVSPDDSEACQMTALRGTQDWAPPRAQIIFTMHPSPSRKSLMQKQKYRCAGCGMRVAPQYSTKFRYCDYLGKYFCTGCHKNQVSLIPAKVIHKWDFNRYSVSTFSYKLLEQMYTDPLFRIFELNKNIEKMSSNLASAKKYRLGLFYLKEYVFACRYAETIQERLTQDLPPYFLSKLEEYSMADLVAIKSGEMKKKLNFLVDICCKHTSECKLCLARGFLCEICNADDIIFPWQMKLVTRCERCHSCYHLKCWKAKSVGICLKCDRINKRKEQGTSTV